MTYYRTTIHTIRKDLCSYCGVKDGIKNQKLKKCYKTNLPICEECKKFKEPMKRMPHKTAEVTECFQKKKTLTPACIVFYLTIFMMYFTVLMIVAIKKYICKFKGIISEN